MTSEALAARKAELCAEAGKLRREFRDQAMELKPVVNLVELGVDAAGWVKVANGIVRWVK